MDLICIDKPEGITTHQSELNDWGIVEFIAHKIKQPLYVIHRLDKETSGAMLVAKNSETARLMTERFQKQDVKKKYLLLTDRQFKDESFHYKSYIEKEKNAYISRQDKPANSETEFQLLWNDGKLSLWEARPITGKSHQIRLHAMDLGIPILGDNLHQGSPWYRLCLHADQIINDQIYTVLKPWWSLKENSHIIKQSMNDKSFELLALLKIAYEKRCRLNIHNSSSYRFSHEEAAHFTIDIYEAIAWVNWYKETPPSSEELNTIENFFKLINKSVFIRHMLDRGKNPNSNSFWTFGKVPINWSICENNLLYEIRTDQGLSAGLFLDQKMNRQWVQSQSKNLRVLNLFSYTCGFSVSAAMGHAQEVCSVDASQNFLNWGKKNFEINNLNANDYEFWSQDCLLFLKGALKRARNFDLIIVDPPSFGRSKDSTFRLEKDWMTLLDLCLKVLADKGQILFTTNFEKWSTNDFTEKINSWSKKNKLQTSTTPVPELDFELSMRHRLLKSVIIMRQTNPSS